VVDSIAVVVAVTAAGGVEEVMIRAVTLTTASVVELESLLRLLLPLLLLMSVSLSLS